MESVPKTCTHNSFVNKPFASWKHATVTNNDYAMRSLDCKGAFYKCFDLNFLGRLPVTVMTNCQHNEMNSFHQRYLKETPEMAKLDWSLIDRIINNLANELRPHFNGPIGIEEFLGDKKGRMGSRYTKAYNDVYNHRRTLKDISGMSAFIKLEKYNDPTKSPRFIMGRDPRFNLLYGLFTTPLEHAFTKLPQVAKGKNFKERGEAFQRLVGEWYLENDFSKFEGSQRYPVLCMELLLMKKLLNKADFEVYSALWSEKLVKKGYTSNNIKFRFEQCRGSGDMDTGLGNTTLNYIAMKYFLIKNGIDENLFLVDGDDGVAKVPRLMREFKNTFLDFGFDAKLVIREDYHDVEFCSSKFIQIQPGVYYQVQNLMKLLSNIQYLLDPRFVPAAAEYFASLGFMYQVVYRGIPLFHQLGNFLRGAVPEKFYVKPDSVEHNYGIKEAFKHSKNLMFEVDHKLAYLEVMLAFGLSPVEMERIAHLLSAKLHVPPQHTKALPRLMTPRLRAEQLVSPITLVDFRECSQFREHLHGNEDLLKLIHT